MTLNGSLNIDLNLLILIFNERSHEEGIKIRLEYIWIWIIHEAVNGLSYNQLVEKIIANKNHSDSKLVTESLVAQNFLEESASQLTYHGLCELGVSMKENELAIFFRNNHFSTIHKRNNVSFFLDYYTVVLCWSKPHKKLWQIG